MLSKVVVFIFGAVIGSFLNVCIHRMPKGESVVWPGSHCPHCKKKIPGYDNIPFISYILLKGRCRFCKGGISLRYPLVELLTAALLVALFIRFNGPSYSFFIYAVLASLLIIATFIDIDHRIIPDEVSVGGMIVGFILVSISGFRIGPFGFSFSPLLDSFLGLIAGGATIYLTGLLFDLVYFRLLKRPAIQGETESMGGGDVKLLAMIGAFLGWERAVMTFFLAPFLGVLPGVANLVAKKDHTLPYGPYLALACLLSLFWFEKIMSLVLVH